MVTNESSAFAGGWGRAFRIVVLSFLVTAVTWSICAWPLPLHLHDAVPHAALHMAQRDANVYPMEPGDHLQLLYHFWLFRDMLTGQTPWFGNIYEFNLGDDGARRETGAYYFPFSLFFAVGDLLAGRAFGWNLASFCSFWLTTLFTWWLARRLGAPSGLAWLLAAASLCVPYRWYQLGGGSPTGFSMCWPPLLLLGLDMAVREDRARGGITAGLALLMAGWGDTHTLFFGALLTPVWCGICFIRRPEFEVRRPDAWMRLVAALVPVAVGLFLVVLTTQNMTGSVEKSAMPGRTPREVMLCSPGFWGLLSQADLGISNQIYLGSVVAVLCMFGGLVVLWHGLRDKGQWRHLLAAALVGIAIVGVIALSLGFRGWRDGLAIRIARELIPQYDMIRQPAKIYTLMPVLLAVFSAFVFRSATQLWSGARVRIVFSAAILAIMADHVLQYRVRLSDLQDSGAYAAMASDAARRGETPRAVVVPFWPGDSHYTSVYQHFASLHRIRMVNGYRPFVPKSYREDLFKKIEPLNEGRLSEDLLALLLSMGVRYVVLHEDLFPEKVSPRPVTFTLKQFLNHPRLELLRHDGSMWSWRILDEPRVVEPVGRDWNIWFPSGRVKPHELDPFTANALQLAPGQSIRLPAPLFFHRGTVDPDRNCIIINPRRDKKGIFLYGPRLPIPSGDYEVKVDFTDSEHGGSLGEWHVECPERTRVARQVMHSDEPFTCRFTAPQDGTLMLVFDYEGYDEFTISALTLKRVR